jgi:hypothetical protein
MMGGSCGAAVRVGCHALSTSSRCILQIGALRTKARTIARIFLRVYMDVQLLSWARYAELNSDGSLTIIGASKDLHQVPSLPWTFPWFYVVTRLILDKDEVASVHKLQYILINPDNEMFVQSEEINIDQRGELPSNREFLHAHSMLVIANFVATKEGYYQIQLRYDGDIVKKALFRVEIQPQPACSVELQESGS